MEDNKTSDGISRRALLGGTTTLGVAGASKMVLAGSDPDNLPPNVSEWTPYLGTGVDANPYGMPSEYENHVSCAATWSG